VSRGNFDINLVVRFRTGGCTHPHNANRKILKKPNETAFFMIGLTFALRYSGRIQSEGRRWIEKLTSQSGEND